MSARKVSGHTIAARVAAAVVALVAGAASFSHISHVAMAAGERRWVALALPFAIDGLILVGVSALLEDKRQGLRPRPVARVAIATGVIATLGANLASAAPTLTGRLVAIVAPVSFLLAVETLTRRGRRMAEVATEPAAVIEPMAGTSAPDVTVKSQRSEPEADTSPVATRRRQRGDTTTLVAAAMATKPDASISELARLAGVSRDTARRYRAELAAKG